MADALGVTVGQGLFKSGADKILKEIKEAANVSEASI